jgi:hypothetical protein
MEPSNRTPSTTVAKEHLQLANYVDQKKRNAITVDQAANRV